MQPEKSGFLTSEFWLALAGLAGKVIVLLVTVNILDKADQDNLTRSITDLILAVGALVTIAYGVNSYSSKRTELKARKMAYMMGQPYAPPTRPGV